MTIANITTTSDNGVERITNNQQVTGTGGSAGSIDSESVILDGPTSVLETGLSVGEINIDRSIITIDSDVDNGNDENSILNYGGREVTTTNLRLRNSTILIKPLSNRINIQLTEISDSKIIESDDTIQAYIYTGTDSIVTNVYFRGFNTWELYKQPADLINVVVDTCQSGYLNWEAGRLDFIGFDTINLVGQELTIGAGDLTNNCWHWNNGANFDNTNIAMTKSEARYYDGRTICWQFRNRDTNNRIEFVKVKIKDDFPGNGASMIERGEYISNNMGRLTGIWDSRLRTTGIQTNRQELFLIENAAVRVDEGNPGAYSYPTTAYTGWDPTIPGLRTNSYNYALDSVVNEIEIKAFLYEAPLRYINGDILDLVQIGSIDGTYQAVDYVNFILVPDLGITQTTQATVDAYTTLETLDKAYDRIKAEWYNNDAYPLPEFAGGVLNLGTIDLFVDGNAVTAYAFTAGDIIISTNTGAKNLSIGTTVKEITTSGIVTVQDGATINGITINGDVALSSAEDISNTTIIGDLRISTGLNSILTFSNVTVDGSVWNDAASNTLMINAINGSSLIAGDPGTNNGQTNIVNPVTLEVTGVSTGTEPTNYVRCNIDATAGGPESIGTNLMNEEAQTAVGDGTYKATEAYNYTSDQPVTIRARYKGYLPFTTTGIIKNSGLIITAIWQIDVNYN